MNGIQDEKNTRPSTATTQQRDQQSAQDPPTDAFDIVKEWEDLKKKYEKKKWFKKAELDKVQDGRSLIEQVTNKQGGRGVQGNEPSRAHKIRDSLVRLMAVYEPLFSVFKGMDSHGVPAGALVYGCLFLFVQIGRNQKQREDTINDGLETIEQWLRVIQEYRDIYDEDVHILDHARKMYQAVFKFVFMVCEYFYRGRRYRLFISATTPADSPLSEAFKRINDVGTKITIEATKNLSLQMSNLSLQITQFRTEWEKSEEGNAVHKDEMKKNHEERVAWQQRQEADQKSLQNQKRLNDLRDIQLRLDAPEKEDLKARASRLNQWQDDWENTIGPDSENFERGTMNTLTENTTFQRFRGSEKANLMLVLGLNHPNAHDQPELWLSPAFVELASSKHRAFYYCVTSKPDDLSRLVSAMIVAILGWDLDFFNGHRHVVEKALYVNSQSAQGLQWRISLFRDLINAWTSTRLEHQSYFVLDRVDRCLHRTHSVQADATREESFKNFLRGLLGIVRDLSASRRRAKILLLAEQSAWPNTYDLKFWQDEFGRQNFLVERDWQQGSF